MTLEDVLEYLTDNYESRCTTDLHSYYPDFDINHNDFIDMEAFAFYVSHQYEKIKKDINLMIKDRDEKLNQPKSTHPIAVELAENEPSRTQELVTKDLDLLLKMWNSKILEFKNKSKNSKLNSENQKPHDEYTQKHVKAKDVVFGNMLFEFELLIAATAVLGIGLLISGAFGLGLDGYILGGTLLMSSGFFALRANSHSKNYNANISNNNPNPNQNMVVLQ